MPVLACVLPLLPALTSETTVSAAIPDGIQIMSISRLMDVQMPEFSIKIWTLVLAIYFMGVAYSSFRLADRLWLITQFLQSKGNSPNNHAAWHGNSTVLMGHLMLNWERMSEQEKALWANHWLPIHPVFGWEAFLVELSVIANWWNPLAYTYRRHWAKLYANWQQESRPMTGKLGVHTLGYAALIGGLALGFAYLPPAISPSILLGKKVEAALEITLIENIVEKPHEYLVQWGDLKLPLKKYANPNGFSAEIEVELTDFQKVIKKELKVFKDGKPVKPGTLSMLYKSNQRGRQAYLNGIDPKKVKLLERQSGIVFNDSLGLGDELVLFGDTEDIYLSRIEIKIKDPEAGYKPPIFVPELSQLEPQMHYQIVARKGKRALVKIDPEHPNADRILKLYANSQQYEIVYLPGFRTNRHYLTEAETVASKVAAANTDLTFLEQDAFYLPEFQGYQGKDVRVTWGSMEAATSSPNYPLDSFLLSIAHEPNILIGEDSLELVSYEVIIAGKNREAKSYHTYRTSDLNLRGAFRNMKDETSIYFDKIVVKDSMGQSLLFPGAFAFHTGKPNKYQNEMGFMPGKNFIFKEGAKPEIIELLVPKNDSISKALKSQKILKTKN
ncbi:MAG: hypothetical protein IT258_19620 [Saprospiraceae bacterium]|nr:hypothetical protein [Saprospiraceae bacterium]